MRVGIDAGSESTNHGEDARTVRRVDGIPVHDGGSEGGLWLPSLLAWREGREGGRAGVLEGAKDGASRIALEEKE